MQWEVMPDLFFYRDPEEAEKEERERFVSVQRVSGRAFLGMVDNQYPLLSNLCAISPSLEMRTKALDDWSDLNLETFLKISSYCYYVTNPIYRAEAAEAAMVKQDFTAPPKEEWVPAEGNVEDWAADGQAAAPAVVPAPAAVAAPAAPAPAFQVGTCRS